MRSHITTSVVLVSLACALAGCSMTSKNTATASKSSWWPFGSKNKGVDTTTSLAVGTRFRRPDNLAHGHDARRHGCCSELRWHAVSGHALSVDRRHSGHGLRRGARLWSCTDRRHDAAGRFVQCCSCWQQPVCRRHRAAGQPLCHAADRRPRLHGQSVLGLSVSGRTVERRRRAGRLHAVTRAWYSWSKIDQRRVVAPCGARPRVFFCARSGVLADSGDRDDRSLGLTILANIVGSNVAIAMLASRTRAPTSEVGLDHRRWVNL